MITMLALLNNEYTWNGHLPRLISMVKFRFEGLKLVLFNLRRYSFILQFIVL